jgi:hypothetical protein
MDKNKDISSIWNTKIKPEELLPDNPEKLLLKKKTDFLNTDVGNFLIKLGILPRYTEIIIFLTSIIFLLLFFTNLEFKNEIFTHSERDLFLAIFFIPGIIYSIVNIFIKKKGVSGKNSMLIFTVIINAIAGVSAGSYSLFNTEKYLIVFPIFNIINAFLLITLLKFGNDADITSISDEQPKIGETAIGFFAVILIFFLSQYILKNYWAITFSICVFYISVIDNFIKHLFFKRDNSQINISFIW